MSAELIERRARLAEQRTQAQERLTTARGALVEGSGPVEDVTTQQATIAALDEALGEVDREIAAEAEQERQAAEQEERDKQLQDLVAIRLASQQVYDQLLQLREEMVQDLAARVKEGTDLWSLLRLAQLEFVKRGEAFAPGAFHPGSPGYRTAWTTLVRALQSRGVDLGPLLWNWQRLPVPPDNPLFVFHDTTGFPDAPSQLPPVEAGPGWATMLDLLLAQQAT